jgi:hypothetical protein
MTGPTDSHRGPGTILLKISRLLFNAHVQATVVQPTIADLQREVADAGHSRVKRMRARWRGYRAFWTLTLLVPFATWARTRGGADAGAFPDATTGVAVTLIVLTLLGLVGPAIGGGVTIIAAASTLVAVLIHRWYARHPSLIPTPPTPAVWSPQINFSSTEVAGNVGGLIFVVGSVFIVVIGLPAVIWFLIAGTAAGCLLAWGLNAWHTKHPQYGLPANRIVRR